MAKHLTTKDLRACLLKTLSESRLRASRVHLEGCADCRSALEEERQRLAVLDAFTVEIAPDGLSDRTLFELNSVKGKANVTLSPQRVISVWLASVAALLALLIVFNTGRDLMDREREYASRAATQNNMKQLGLIFKMFANESPGGSYPALAGIDGIWAPDLAPLQDEYLSDPLILASKEHPSRKKIESKLSEAWNSTPRNVDDMTELMGESYAYLGYSIANESDFEAMVRARASHEIPRDDNAVSGKAGGTALQPLREGVDRFMITDINNAGASAHAQSTIPVLIEIATWKYKESVEDFKGANVLYMDGHVAFVPLGTFPVLPSIMDVLSGGK